jgi:hypothetical protein
LIQNVLFQTDNPTCALGRVEFYDIVVNQQEIGEQLLHIVQETHGWWDNQQQRAIVDEGAEVRTECFLNFGAALDKFSRWRVLRARSGFMHSFMWHPINKTPAYHMPVELDVESPEQSSASHSDEESAA